MGEKEDDEDRVRVFLRIRPGKEGTSSPYKVNANDKQLHCLNVLGNVDRSKKYVFDHIYDEKATNKTVQEPTQELVDCALKGFNCALFAYGQTSSGKTYTLMSGDGMTAHLVSRLFARVAHDPNNNYEITCSYLQIYQERIFDLLNSNPKLEFRLREDPQKGVFVENASSYRCYNPNDVYELLNIGRKRLVFAETKMNRLSSRSHAICQIFIKKSSKENSTPRKISQENGIESPPLVRRPSLPKQNSTGSIKRHRRTYSDLDGDVLQHGTFIGPEIQRSSKIPVSRSTSFRKTRSKTPELNKQRVPSLNNLRSGSLSARYERAPSSLSSLSRQSGRRSQAMSSCESLASSITDFDDMKWQLGESDMDLTQIEDGYLSDASSIDRPIIAGKIIRGKISIVDLAGSERNSRTKADGITQRESKFINTSLLELGNVVSALSEKKKHVPYRNSKLTRLSQDSLSGNCKTSFILCISPAVEDISETDNTLQFGQRLQKVSTKPTVNIEPDYKALVEELKTKLKDSEFNFDMKTKEYESRLKILRNELSQTEEDLSHHQQLSKVAKEELDNFKHKHNDTRRELEMTKNELSGTTEQLKTHQTKVQDLRKQNKDFNFLDVKFNEVKKELEIKKNTLNEASLQLDQKCLEMNSLEFESKQFKSNATEESITMKKEMVKIRYELTEKTCELDERNNEMMKLKKQNYQTIQQLNKLQKEVEEKKNEINEKTMQLSRKDTEISIFHLNDKENKNIATQQIGSLKKELEVSKIRLRKASDEMSSKESKIKEIQSLQTLNKENIAIIIEEKKKMKSEVDVLKYELKNKVLELEDRDEEILELKKQSQELMVNDEKYNVIKVDLDDIKVSLMETAMLLEEKEREIDVLQFQNKRISKQCDEYENKCTVIEKLLEEKPRKLCFDIGTMTSAIKTSNKGCSAKYHDTCCDEKLLLSKDKALQQKKSELEDAYAEYKLLLDENESLRKEHRLPPRERKRLRRSRFITGKVDQMTETDTILKKDACVNTNRSSMPCLAVHKKCSEREIDRLRTFLLAEVMSLQLMYSMFDLKTRAQLEKENDLVGVNLEHSICERLANSTTSTTPSGYETGSDLTVDDKDCSNKSCSEKSVKKSGKIKSKKTNKKSQSVPSIESGLPKAGTSLNEIIEAQRSGSLLLSNPGEVKELPIETRVKFLKNEICQQKKAMDEELIKVAIQHFGIVEPGGRLNKREIYTGLVEKLSEKKLYSEYTLDSLEQILNLVLVDHSLTGSLLALSHKTKKSTLNMIRRLSSFKSTNQTKSLLDYSYFDHELYGYENEACIAFNSDESDETMPENFNDILNNDETFIGDEEDGLDTHRQHCHEKNFGMLALDSESSDSDGGSPVPQKKGLRRFFCMPKKSLKPTLKASSPANALRRSFRKPKRKDPVLIEEEE